MILSEEEAKTKACRAWGAAVEFRLLRTLGADAVSTGEPRCLGSGCMHWRWAVGDPDDSTSKGGILLPPEQWPGYCGLAGEPRRNEGT